MNPAQVLVLTPWYTPHKIVGWQVAICMLFLGKVEVLEEYDEVLRATSLSMKMPAVVRLKRAIGNIKRGMKFSRVNVLQRDRFTCQYCGKPGTVDTLNYDHVLPRSQGGKTVWENITTSCYPCNSRKANHTPEQAGMVLLSKPHKPKTLPMAGPIVRTIHPKWEPWMGLDKLGKTA